ncbi:MAG: hypothetical protein PHN84_03270 [Desulfuromonadaceae bacterium]|nr:hypothetical protein [Desulfuromonadaceae bacterium]MDD2856280.1 hypothetical protein [Desulfuromonadaceae bacterium]
MGAYLTPLGGVAVQLINKTGAPSVKGSLVCPSPSTDAAVRLTETDDIDPCGVILNSGVSDGSDVWVVVSGVAEVLLEDSTAATRGYWARTSITQAGRANITAAVPAGGTITAIEAHMKEVGHSLESVTAGTNKLCRIFFHTN